MTCREVRELLFAFLDNELDAQLSIELQRHLEHCCDCAREAEIERVIRKRLEFSLAEHENVPVFDEARLVQNLTGKAPELEVSRRSRRLWRVGLAAGFLMLVSAAAGLMLRQEYRQFTLADLIIDDFSHVLSEEPHIQVASNDPEVIAAWLKSKINLDVRVPAMHGPTCKLIGARKCSISERSAALALYEMNGSPASLVAMDSEETDFVGMRQADTGHWVDHCKGHTVVARKVGGLTYAAVGRMSEEDLLHLIPADNETKEKPAIQN